MTNKELLNEVLAEIDSRIQSLQERIDLNTFADKEKNDECRENRMRYRFQLLSLDQLENELKSKYQKILIK